MANESWDEDDRLGVPRAGVQPLFVDRPLDHEELFTDAEPNLRDRDAGLGRPGQVPRELAPLDDADRQLLRETDERQALRELEEAEELLASDPAVGWAGWFAHPLAAAFLIGSAGALGLFLYSQALTILGHLAVQPPAIQYPGYTALAILAFAVSYSMLRLVVLYAKLRRNRQIRVEGLAELQSRTRLRWLAAAKSREARERLEQYLRGYPLNTERERKALAKLGLTPAQELKLAAVKAELLDPARFTSTTEWFDRFRDGFQAELDRIADQRVSYWANRAMLVTAISPNGFVDSVSTTYFGFAMIADLCRVYNLRAGRTGTAVLLGRVFFNAYLAGNLNDFEKLAEEQYDHLFEQGFQVVGIGVSSNVVSKFLGKVGAKATAGYLNRVLLLRLGRYASRLLRPVSQD